MDPQVRKEFDEIRSILREGALRADRMERRFDDAYRKAMLRMDRADQRMDRTDQRLEKMDKQIQTTRKLVEAGMKLVSKLAADTRELKQSQKAFLDSLRKGNGNGHHR